MNPVRDSRIHWQYVLIVALLAIIVGAGILGYRYWWSPREKTKSPQGKPPDGITKDEKANWKTYRNEKYGYELKYPENLITVSEVGDTIVMTHSVPLEHNDPCDFRGDAPPLRTLTDFEVSIEVASKNLRETIIGNESDYLVSKFLLDNTLKVEPGFIDEINIGSLTGYRITSGVEGCGEYGYYFPVSSNKTLIVIRSFITELKPITPGHEEYLTVPGVISPEEEEGLFNQILSTFRLLE